MCIALDIYEQGDWLRKYRHDAETLDIDSDRDKPAGLRCGLCCDPAGTDSPRSTAGCGSCVRGCAGEVVTLSGRDPKSAQPVQHRRISNAMSWLTTYYIYVLFVVSPGGMETQIAVYPEPQACEAARDLYSQQEAVKQLGLRAECRQRVRSQYSGR